MAHVEGHSGGAVGWIGWLVGILPLSLFIWYITMIPAVSEGHRYVFSAVWIETLAFRFTLEIDGLALLFLILISGIGFLIFGYAGHYLQGHRHLGRCYLYLTAFMFSMLGLVAAGDLITLFIFWELTSITSYLLIGLDHDRKSARDAALQALLVTGGGGLALLVGFILLGQVAGTFDLGELALLGSEVQGSALYVPILLLILLGAFTKSAQVPFHFWLPNAMEAPTPVSAYLHSATMVKAGVYLLARLSIVLSGRDEWVMIVTTAGVVTMLVGAVMAFLFTDLKRVLAYSTISALGTLVFLLGLGTPAAANAAIVFLLAHALYKAALFMIAGVIDHQTGTREVTQLGGLRAAMPITATIALVAAVSLAGFGPVLSFIGKEMLLEAVFSGGRMREILLIAALISAALLTAVAGMVAIRPFFGKRRETPVEPHEAGAGLLAGPLLLAFAGLILGLMPDGVTRGLIAPAAASVTGVPEELHLALWHGVNLPLMMSAASVIVGVLLFLMWEKLRTFTVRLSPLKPATPSAMYAYSLAALNSIARGQTRILQNGYLRVYLMTVFATVLALMGLLVLRNGMPPVTLADWSNLRFYEVVVAVMILAGAFVAVRSESRLGAVAALGVVGYSVALMYIIFSAPDLAMTQFVIETLTVVIFVLVLYHLPRYAKLSSSPARLRDAIISIAVGVLMTVLVLAVTHTDVDAELSRFYVENSVGGGHGRNIVNVILVDFRALDTLGEITVLAIAAIGVFAMLKLRVERNDT